MGAAIRPVGVAVTVGASLALVSGLLLGATVVSAVGGGATGLSPAAIADIPAEYESLYRGAAAEFALGMDGWSVLAAVGKIECDHGRSESVGCHRGEVNAAGAGGPAQFLASTWAAYGVDANGDGRRDRHDPADAIYGMARYLQASGAPDDWRRALFAYNHAGWYVDRVLQKAAEYRAGPTLVAPPIEGWLAPLPDFPGERCDARIAGEVTLISRTFGVRVTDCYGGAPHELDGDHPLGLAADVVPSDGNWDRTLRLAERFGWQPTCAPRGCPGVGPFGLILYNGYPDHGDPQHSSRPHLHLSWAHGPAAPFSPAPWVRPVLVGAAQ
jgi:hypothetical protein